MNTARRIALSAYLVSATLILAPFADAWTSLYPWHPGDSRWRFGAIGVMSNASVLPLLGVLIALAIAMWAEQRAMRRVINVIAFVAGGLGVLLLGLFALDALQTQSAVRPEMRLSFVVASVTAGAKLLLMSATLIAIGFAARRRRGEGSDANVKRPGSEPMIWSSEPRAPARN